MKRQIGLWALAGFAVTSLLGTLLHFFYGWLEKSPLVAPFSSVNESTFEHIKLLFWPLFFYALFQGLFFRERKDLWCIKLRGILLGIFLIPFLFYMYNGVIGKSPDFINIAIFFVAAALAYLYEYRQMKKPPRPCHPRVALAVLVGIALLLILFTFLPPRLALFRDPVTGSFGIV